MADPETYRTVAGRGRAAFEIRGSAFVGYAAPAHAAEEAEAFVDEVGADHPDATHVVPAYRVRVGDAARGSGFLREYSSDDGEPAGSAGKPALSVLEGRDLEDAAVAVVRYFGGTELGVGGLARAYSRGAKEAVAAAGVVERLPHERAVIAVDYDDSGTVRGVLESEGVEFDAAYEARVTFEADLPVPGADRIRDRLRSATGGRVEIEGGDRR